MNRLAILLFVLSTPALTGLEPVNLVFTYRVTATGQANTLLPNGTITLPSTDPTSATAVTFYAQNRETDDVVMDQLHFEGTGFTVSGQQATTLGPNQVTSLTIGFQSAKPGLAAGLLSLRFTVGGRQSRYTFYLSTNVLESRLTVSYVVPGGNQLQLRNGDTLVFPSILATQTTSATVIILNSGSGRGQLDRAVTAEGAFRVSGLPLLPASVLPEREIRFTVTFAPAIRGEHSGVLVLAFPGETLQIRLSGVAKGPAYTFEFLFEGTPLETAGDTLLLPETPVGQSRNVLVRVRNSGDAEGRLASVTMIGSAYRVTDVPPLPMTLAEGQTAVFQVVFTPAATGVLRGQLRVDGASFELVATVRGARFSLVARIGTVETAIVERGTINFSNTAAGARAVATLVLTNEGNASGTVSNLGISGTGFALLSTPTLPALLPEGGMLEFAISFSPENTGVWTGTLQMDDRSYFLRGVGSTPEPLPAVAFQALEDRVAPFAQPVVGLSLISSYPHDVTGTLTLTFAPDTVGDDPAVQFSNGLKTVSFRIVANAKEAVFGSSGTRIAFQAGTVAGTITLNATLQVGAINMTPAVAPSKVVRLVPEPPSLRSVVVNTRNDTVLEVLVTGYATTRSLSQMQLTLTPAPGATLQTAALTADVESAFRSWFQSTASRTYGSQFTATLVLNVTGSVTAIQTIAVSASNDLGSSAPVTANVR
ncbi:MAG: choice-of-anchor D domain-containing protein [Bryobacterales bacterium]|nr:choice-of-anchor D domain-containing protein [Bryobacterales bacterium]